MALSLIVETGAGLTTSNAYATAAEGNSYHETHLHSSVWDSAVTEDRQTALVMATRLLDEWVNWTGYKVDEDQALRWPRYSVLDRDGYAIDSDIVPVFLKNATAELARSLLAGDPTTAPDTLGYSKMKVGPLELEIDKEDRDDESVIPDAVASMIEPYGTIRSRGGSSTAKLIRT